MSIIFSPSNKFSLKWIPISLVTAMVLSPDTFTMTQLMAAEETINVKDAGNSERENVVETIIVTATRRETNLQLTASAISAVSGANLEDLGKSDIQSYMDSVPGITMISEGGGLNRVVFRNISASSQQRGSSTTAAYFNDFALSTSSGGAPDIRLVDINRVEVIKGPQGTLFGRSAMGGIVRYISNEPNVDRLEGGFNSYVSNTTDGGTNFGGSAYLNLPVNDNLAIRMVAYNYQNDGYIDNVELGIADTNEEDTVGGRFALRWFVNDALTFDFNYLNQSLEGSRNSVSTTRDPGDLNVAGDEGPNMAYDIEARTNISGLLAERSPSTDILNLKLEYANDSFITTLQATRLNSELDWIIDDREYVEIRSGVLPGVAKPSFEEEVDTIELRVVSVGNDFVDWIAGYYYEDSDGKTHMTNSYFGPDQLLYGFIPMTNGVVPLDNEDILKAHEEAVYGEIGLNFSEDTRLLLGYRYSDIEFSTESIKADGFFNLLQGFNLLVGIPFETQETVSTYKLSLEHRFNEDTYGYALASSGYRRGGFNRPTAISAFSTYDSDSLWNYELGVKKTWLAGRLVSNVSAYYLDWNNMQLLVSNPITFNPETKNVGKASVTGVEFDIEYVLNHNWRFAFGGSISDPKLEEDVPPSINPYTGQQVFTGRKGDRLPASAKETLFFTSKYAMSISSEMDLFANISVRYIGDRLNDFNTDLDVTLASYSLTDMRIGLSFDNGWNVALFADNMFDKAAELSIDRQGMFFERVPTNRPRTVGLNIYYNFR